MPRTLALAMRAGLLALAGILALLPALARAAAPPVLDFRLIVQEGQHSSDCALTFDDGPGEYTVQLLDLLAARDIKATFFMLGQHAQRYPDVVRRIVQDGHEVENHSWDHPDMRRLNPAQRTKELQDTDSLLRSLGAAPRFFRPPYGVYDRRLIREAKRQGLSLILWSHDSQDWHDRTPAEMESNVLPSSPNAGAHGIFLFHDTHPSTIAAMPAVLDALAANRCHFVTVQQWIHDNIAPPAPAPAPAPTPPAVPRATPKTH